MLIWFYITEFTAFVDEDKVTVRIKANVDGQSVYRLDDDPSYKSCNIIAMICV